jgi:hypothetical protein
MVPHVEHRCLLGSDVLPLKSNPAGGSGRVKIRLSVQQTQKSFSMIAAVSARRLAVAPNRSVQSATGRRATSSMTHQLLLVLSDLADDVRDPVGCVPRFPAKLLPLFR